MNRTFDPVTLRLFVAVCEEHNIARATDRRGVEPTAAGEVPLRQARGVLGIMGRMHAELSEFAGGADRR